MTPSSPDLVPVTFLAPDLLLAAGKIDQPTVDQMRCWPHSGFSVDNSVYLSARDTPGLERLAQYILRCSFSLARVVRLTDDGLVLYRAEQDHCRRFPGAASADLRGGPRRNFQVFSALDFLAEVTQQIPDKGEHLVRYCGWYLHRQRGLRAKSDSEAVSEGDSNADENDRPIRRQCPEIGCRWPTSRFAFHPGHVDPAGHRHSPPPTTVPEDDCTIKYTGIQQRTPAPARTRGK